MTSGRITEAELEDLKGRNPCDVVAGAWVSLRRHGQKMIGPCPVCSPDPRSRDATRFECDAAGWVCAVCADGGDVIRLVERVNGCSFMDAIAFLGGKRELVPGEAALAEAHRAQLRAEREREAKAYRERERRKLWAMWHAGRDLSHIAPGARAGDVAGQAAVFCQLSHVCARRG